MKNQIALSLLSNFLHYYVPIIIIVELVLVSNMHEIFATGR